MGQVLRLVSFTDSPDSRLFILKILGGGSIERR